MRCQAASRAASCRSVRRSPAAAAIFLEAAEEVLRVADLLHRVLRYPTTALSNLDDAYRLQPAQRVHDCLLTPSYALSSSIEMRDPAEYFPSSRRPSTRRGR